MRNFLFETPLYTELTAKKETSEEKTIHEILRFQGKVDGYNPFAKYDTTFFVSNPRNKNWVPNELSNRPIQQYGGLNILELKCLRQNLIYYVIVYVSLIGEKDDNDTAVITHYKLVKMGQYPSIADIHISQIKDYGKVLSKEKMKEFTKAIGLAAHGVGIGSFVYLRRIFEALIEEAHGKAKELSDWNEELFTKSRMGEKVALVKEFLPEFLVQHQELYGILSKGIHELEEQECLSHFNSVKAAIEIILDAKLFTFEREQKIREASKTLKQLQRSLSSTINKN